MPRPHHRATARMRWLLLVVLAWPVWAGAQSFEAAAQFTGVHLHKIDEAPLGIGARIHYTFLPHFAADLELTKYPRNTAALFGVRAGKRFRRVGIFLKARAGVIHFGGGYFEQRLDHRTRQVADIGGVIEFYPSARTFLRIDEGDTIIYYGAARLYNRPNPDALGTVHNYQPGFGIGFRF